MDHLLFYRAGAAAGGGPCYIVKNDGGSFSAVFASHNGIGGNGLGDDSDQLVAFDYDLGGHMDHVLCYRPGTGTVWILRNTNGTFKSVLTSSGPGIGGFNLLDVENHIIAADYDSTRKNDCLLIYRPGPANIRILRHVGNDFQVMYSSEYVGIGEFDLSHPNDQIIGVGNGAATSDGAATSTIAACRPGGGNLYLLTRRSGLYK